MKGESKTKKRNKKFCGVLFVNFAKSFVCLWWRAHFEMLALSEDRHNYRSAPSQDNANRQMALDINNRIRRAMSLCACN